MPVYLVQTVFGIFLLDQASGVIGKQLTYPDVGASILETNALNKGIPTENLRRAIEGVEQSATDIVVVESSAMARALSALTKTPVRVEENSATAKLFRTTLDRHLLETGIVASEGNTMLFKHEVAVSLAKSAVSTATEAKDLLVKHAIDAVGEIDKSINIATMRLREWYSLHHSTLSGLIEDQEQFVRAVIACMGRQHVTEDRLRSAGLPDALIQSVIDRLDDDIGADFDEADLTIINRLAGTIQGLYDTRRELEKYIESMMKRVAPNMISLVGPMVGARLISLAGTIRNLAQKPSSTVQVYGAEKALFRSLKTGTDPPKHGVIYQVPEVYSAPYWQRGKIARALAGKLSIAAKIDAYSRRDAGTELRGAFERRLEEIRKHDPEAPKKEPQKRVGGRQVRAPPPRRSRGRPQRRWEGRRQ